MAETEIILKVILNGEGNHDCQKGCQMLALHHIIHTLVDRGSWYSMFMFFTFAISVLSHSAMGFSIALIARLCSITRIMRSVQCILTALLSFLRQTDELRPMQLM